jgi:hypothetical protein
MTTSVFRSVEVVDPELSGSGGRPPVDPAQPVPCDERPKIRELDPVPSLAGDLVAGGRLSRKGPEDRAQPLRRWIDLERQWPPDALLVDEESGRVAGAHRRLAKRESAPPAAPDPPRELRALPAAQSDERRVRPVLDLGTLRQDESDLRVVDRGVRSQLELQADRLALHGPLRVETRPDAQ